MKIYHSEFLVGTFNEKSGKLAKLDNGAFKAVLFTVNYTKISDRNIS